MTAKQILIIDDEADVREIAKMSLQITKNWDVIMASSSHEGIEIAAKNQPDAILLDVMMPDVDGLTTLHQLRTNPLTQDIPVIFLTATIKVVTQRQYVQLGANAVVMKPFDPGLLASQIEKALGWTAE